MPQYMDVHDMPGATKEAVAAAHAEDLKVQSKHGAKFTDYWFDAKKGKVFCLCEAPNIDAAKAVHADAGHPADQIYEVHHGS